MGTHRKVTARHRDGEEFPIEASISKLEIEGGVLFTVALRDVTHRERAEGRSACSRTRPRRSAGRSTTGSRWRRWPGSRSARWATPA
jgi:hypothetical protein